MQQEKHNQLEFSVRHPHLFKNAIRLLRTAGVWLFHFAVMFRDEVGTGIGPTCEFVTIVARELGLISRGRHHENFKYIYVVTVPIANDVTGCIHAR
jgi:hypothetical protein